MSLSAGHRLLTTSHAFWQKIKFQPGIALLSSLIIDCNHLASPYTPRGTWREMCFAKWSFYLCKTVQACSGVRFSLCGATGSCAGTCISESHEFRGCCLKFHVLSLPSARIFLVDNTPVKNVKLINHKWGQVLLLCILWPQHLLQALGTQRVHRSHC